MPETYNIKYGDTLSGIAAANNTDIKTLMGLNPNISDPNKIYAGSTLNLAAPKAAPVTNIAPVTDPNSPVSSGTYNQGKNVNTATTEATAATAPLTESQQWYMKDAGLTEEDVRALSDSPEKRAAIGGAYQQFRANQADLASSIEAENASWKSTQDKFNIGRQGSLEAAKAGAYAADPYAASSTGVDFGADSINQKYDIAEKQAQAAHSAAIANLKAGNMKAAAANLNQISEIIEKVKIDTANIENQKATQALNNQLKNQTIADKELQTITGATADSILAMPTNINQFTQEQMNTLSGVPGYRALIDSGMTPAEAYAYIKNAATGNKQLTSENKFNLDTQRLSLDTIKAQNALLDSQRKGIDIQNNAALAANSIVNTSKGFKYLDGTQFYGNDAKNQAANVAAQNGAVLLDKNGIEAVRGIESVRFQLGMLKDDLAGRLGGTWEQVINNPKNLTKTIAKIDPTLATLNIYKDTGIKFLIAIAGGMGSGLRITQSEIAAQKKNLPNEYDTVASAQEKFRKMNAFLDEKERGLFPNQKTTSSNLTIPASTQSILDKYGVKIY